MQQAANENAHISEHASPSPVLPPSTMMLSPEASRQTPNIDPAIAIETGYIYSWSLFNYKTAVEEKEDAYAELERSIVAKLADDIIVGVRGKNVEIVVKKSF